MSIKHNFLLLAHEHLFVFRKPEKDKKNFAKSKIFVPNKKNFLSGNFCVAERLKPLRHMSEAKPQPHAQSALKADSGQKLIVSDSGEKTRKFNESMKWWQS